MSRKTRFRTLTIFFLSMSVGAVIGDQGDLAVLSFSAGMLASLFWWGER